MGKRGSNRQLAPRAEMDTVLLALVSIGIELDHPGDVHRALLLPYDLPVWTSFHSFVVVKREHYHDDCQVWITQIASKIGHEGRKTLLPFERVLLLPRIFATLPEDDRPNGAVGGTNHFHAVHARAVQCAALVGVKCFLPIADAAAPLRAGN